MENLLEEYEIDGIKVRIGYEEYPENPRENDNITTMICFHRRYDLGDKHNYNSDDLTFDSVEELKEYLENDYGKILLIQPLYLYDHSGISISTSSFIGRAQHAEWDSGTVGIVFISEKRMKELGVTDDSQENLEGMINEDVKEYDEYIRGNVYRYEVYDKDDNFLDSCGGYVGDSGLEYMKTEIEGNMNYYKRKISRRDIPENQLEIFESVK